MNVDFDENFSTCLLFPFKGVEEGNFVRLTYKKEKQAYYQIRVGAVEKVVRDTSGNLISLLLKDYTANPDQYLDDPGIRNLLASRIGEIEIFAKAAPATPDYDVIEVKVPKSHKALVKIVAKETH